MLVEDVMQPDIVTCAVEDSLREAVEAMLKHHIGSVVIVADDTPAGIVTETDILLAGYATEKCFGEILIEETMSRPLVTIAPSKSLRTAMRMMREERVKKLPVQDGLDLVGIMTMTDINTHYADIVSEIHAMEQPSGFSDAELRGLGGADG